MSSIESFLRQEDIDSILLLPEVQQAKIKLDSCETGKHTFTIEITDSIRTALETKFGIDCSNITSLPMRWIKGDTMPHIDKAVSKFENTYLVYLNDSSGEFLIDNAAYPIIKNTGFIFNEGLYHSTRNTGNLPRLLLGPINEFAEAVGASTVFYYPSEADALANTNIIGQYSSYTIILTGGFRHWRIASTSTGPSLQSTIYNVGDSLADNGLYYIYPVTTCFLEGTTILCDVNGVDTYVPVETMRKGTRVKTSLNGYKMIELIGASTIKNPGNDERIENRLYKCSPSKYPALTSDLYITGCHSILEFPITEKQKEQTIKHLGKLYVTDKKYRLLAYIDERAEPWNSEGTYTVHHFALENENERMNYGVYANGGLLVESSSLSTLRKRTNLKII